MGNAVLQDTDFTAQKQPAAVQATGSIIRASLSLIENRDMSALLAVSQVLGNRAADQDSAGAPPRGLWITTI
jgi:hypothetical protein